MKTAMISFREYHIVKVFFHVLFSHLFVCLCIFLNVSLDLWVMLHVTLAMGCVQSI